MASCWCTSWHPKQEPVEQFEGQEWWCQSPWQDDRWGNKREKIQKGVEEQYLDHILYHTVMCAQVSWRLERYFKSDKKKKTVSKEAEAVLHYQLLLCVMAYFPYHRHSTVKHTQLFCFAESDPSPLSLFTFTSNDCNRLSPKLTSYLFIYCPW